MVERPRLRNTSKSFSDDENKTWEQLARLLQFPRESRAKALRDRAQFTVSFALQALEQGWCALPHVACIQVEPERGGLLLQERFPPRFLEFLKLNRYEERKLFTPEYSTPHWSDSRRLPPNKVSKDDYRAYLWRTHQDKVE